MEANEQYEINQLHDRAENIREALDELDDIKYRIDAALAEQAALLAQYLEDTEEAIPPWEDLRSQNPAQLELPLGDPNG